LYRLKPRRELTAVTLFAVAVFAGCRDITQTSGILCDMTPEGSVWITVARLTSAEDMFRRAHGRYGSLAEMTDLLVGLPPDVTMTGRMGTYTITIDYTKDRYLLRANPDTPRGNPNWAWFYADETGRVTYDRTGPATPESTSM
jgi:hypothetical protein